MLCLLLQRSGNNFQGKYAASKILHAQRNKDGIISVAMDGLEEMLGYLRIAQCATDILQLFEIDSL